MSAMLQKKPRVMDVMLRDGGYSKADKLRFPNLSALRFLAALAVLVFHIEHKKTLYGLPSWWKSSFFLSTIGYHAVTFFFVLSGFLITYLLLAERDRQGTIHVRHFYIRRILRIFPVYFLTIIVAFFVLPRFPWFHVPGESDLLQRHFKPAFGLSMAFMSNVSFAKYGNLACVDQAWSVSTEEQFYLLWPLLLIWVPPRHLWTCLVTLAVGGPVLRWGALHLGGSEMGRVSRAFLELNRFGCMAIGGLGALLIMRKSAGVHRWMTSPWAFWLAMAASIAVLGLNIFPKRLLLVQPEAYSLLFCILIVNFAHGCAVRAPLDSSLLRRAGDLSYAAYMYHNAFIALICNLWLAHGFNIASTMLLNAVLYPAIIGMTFLCSWISYRMMEAPMLRLKDRFSSVHTST